MPFEIKEQGKSSLHHRIVVTSSAAARSRRPIRKRAACMHTGKSRRAIPTVTQLKNVGIFQAVSVAGLLQNTPNTGGRG